MLSDREARNLREIEQRLAAADTRFAAFMNRPVFDRRERRTRFAYDTVIAVSLLSAVLCIALASSGTVYSGLVAAAFAVVTGYLRWQRFAPRPSTRLARV